MEPQEHNILNRSQFIFNSFNAVVRRDFTEAPPWRQVSIGAMIEGYCPDQSCPPNKEPKPNDRCIWAMRKAASKEGSTIFVDVYQAIRKDSYCPECGKKLNEP